MVLLAPLVGAAVFLSGFAAALPTSYGSSGSVYDSSGDSSSDSSSSSYGSDSSYGGDSSNYGSDSSYGGDSSDYNSGDSSTMMMDTETIDSTSTATGYNSYQTSSYGSGSSYWGGSGYSDCVNQCIAQYGQGMGGQYQATATAGVGGYSGGGSGTTHTIIVGPEAGVYRMVPFATNASVGDTIEWLWNTPNHTVTRSSALLPCNKSADAPVFASGEQAANFVFRELVNDTDPIFYYCGTPGHCEKGMFGVINPSMALPGAPTSLGAMMSSIAANDSDISAYAAYMNNATGGNDVASSWADNLDMSDIPETLVPQMMESVMYSRIVMAMNPWVVKGSAIDLSGVNTQSLTLPLDASKLNAASSGSAAASVSAGPTPVGADATSSAPATSASAAPSSSSSSGSNTNGANSVASPRFLVAAVVVVATIFAL